MNPYLFMGVIVIVLWLGGLFIGVVKNMSSSIDNAPTVESSSSRETREEFSQRAADIQEKNQRLMDSVREKMERSR